MRKMKYVKALTAMILLVAMLCGNAMASSYRAKVTSPSAKVYSSAGKGAIAIDGLSRGAAVKVLSTSGSKARVSYKGKTGYVALSKLAHMYNKRVKAVTTKSSSIKFVTKKSYRKRTYYTGTLAAGVTVYVVGSKGKYYLVRNESGSAMACVPKSALRKV